MKIRVKRAGWILFIGLAIAFCCVAAVALFRIFYLKKDVSLPSFAAEGLNSKQKVTEAPSSNDMNMGKVAGTELKNASFEEGYGGVPKVGNQVARINGVIPNGWFDLSSWSDLEAQYDNCQDNPHSGKSCLRIEIKDLKTRSILFAQPLKLTPGKKYMGSVWLRADKQTPVNIGLRMRGKPYFYYGQIGAIAENGWKKFEFPIRMKKDKYPFSLFMVETFTPHSVIYVDDAEIHEADFPDPVASKAPAPPATPAPAH